MLALASAGRSASATSAEVTGPDSAAYRPASPCAYAAATAAMHAGPGAATTVRGPVAGRPPVPGPEPRAPGRPRPAAAAGRGGNPGGDPAGPGAAAAPA